jgi:hypothetical protein
MYLALSVLTVSRRAQEVHNPPYGDVHRENRPPLYGEDLVQDFEQKRTASSKFCGKAKSVLT